MGRFEQVSVSQTLVERPNMKGPGVYRHSDGILPTITAAGPKPLQRCEQATGLLATLCDDGCGGVFAGIFDMATVQIA